MKYVFVSVADIADAGAPAQLVAAVTPLLQRHIASRVARLPQPGPIYYRAPRVHRAGPGYTQVVLTAWVARPRVKLYRLRHVA